ncbi:MAG: hypothetical protein DHS80DRAFT_33807 [Piptocephalis tieghemiana]|nr:MAG: hypothetical protein DHS80DRAFT_33807 [Piptocephalis tieghemiana]
MLDNQPSNAATVLSLIKDIHEFTCDPEMRELMKSAKPKAYPNQPLLSLPSHLDTLEELEEKMGKLIECVKQGYSLASATGSQELQGSYIENPEERAKSRMQDIELKLYRAWKGGRVPLPPYNSLVNSITTPIGINGQGKRMRRAEALDRMYGVRGSTVDNATWWITTYPELIPLINAISRVIGAERETIPLVHHQQVMPGESAEIRIIDSIVATSRHIINQHMAKVRNVVRRVNESISLIETRKRSLGRSLLGETTTTTT